MTAHTSGAKRAEAEILERTMSEENVEIVRHLEVYLALEAVRLAR